MLDKASAQQLVTDYINKDYHLDEDRLVIIEEETIEKPYGWVFFYNSERFLKTSDSEYALAGNGPVIVERATGAVHLFGTAEPPETVIRKYETKRE
jgi:hypothetical protein